MWFTLEDEEEEDAASGSLFTGLQCDQYSHITMIIWNVQYVVFQGKIFLLNMQAPCQGAEFPVQLYEHNDT